jgi:hypothetical protein
MATSTVAPVKRAVVQKLRASSPLVAAIVGGIHEAIAPRKVKYPFIVYQIVASSYEYDWTGMQIHALMDVSTYAVNPVDANNIDALIAGALNDAALTVDGQTSLLCRRVGDLPTGPDVDAEGKRIYQVGGTYSIWTDQSWGETP